MNATQKKHRMRLPNGIGSVHLIGDDKSRRRPWRARVPDKMVYDSDRAQWLRKYITVGYFATETEALRALCSYQKSSCTAESAEITFAELFDRWKARKYPKISPSAQRGYQAAFKNSAPLHHMQMREIRPAHMEQIMAELPLQHGSQSALRSLWSQLFNYGIERDIVQKNYASFVSLRDPAGPTSRTAVSPEDLARLWQAADDGNWTAKLFMVYCYTGMRSSELLAVKKDHVDLSARILVGGLKTEAGKNRRVPIHRDILPILQELMGTPGPDLVMEHRDDHWEALTYQRWYYVLLKQLMAQLDMPYTGHYARHTCATLLREANVADDLRKLILGHANGDITDRYTHHPDHMLISAIDQIPRRKQG